MRWPWDGRGFPNSDTHDRRVVRSFLVAEGVLMPNVGDVMVFGPVAPPDYRGVPGVSAAAVPACRVEGVQGRTVWYVPYGDDAEPLGASRWKLRRVRTGRRRYEEVATRV